MNIQIRAKSLFLTYSQADLNLKDLLRHLCDLFWTLHRLRVSEHVICRELHQDGNPHVHCFIMLSGELRVKLSSTWLDYQGYHPNIQATRSCKRVIEYCTKEDDYITDIQRKIDRYKVEDFKKKEFLAKELMNGKALHTLVDENPCLLFGYNRLKQDLNAYMLDKAICEDLHNVCGLWIAGPAGAGKSTVAFTRFGNYYPKGKNKWFDGYNGQETIVLDDVDGSWKDVCEYFKWWSGKFKFLAEFKGGTMLIRPKKCIVTSNFTLAEMLTKWGIAEPEWGPYQRRFTEYWITSVDDWEEQL